MGQAAQAAKARETERTCGCAAAGTETKVMRGTTKGAMSGMRRRRVGQIRHLDANVRGYRAWVAQWIRGIGESHREIA